MAEKLFDREQLASAVYITNKHAKTAPDNDFLYKLKKETLEKMIQGGLAKKVGLQFVRNPKFSQRQSAVLITCGEFHFHLPASREELKTLPHLGEPDPEYRNPKVRLGLKAAKQILQDYTGLKPDDTAKTPSGRPDLGPGSLSRYGKQDPGKQSPAGRRKQKPSPSSHRSWFDQ